MVDGMHLNMLWLVRMSSVFAILLMVWVFRIQPELPVGSDGGLFSVRKEISPSGLADMVFFSPFVEDDAQLQIGAQNRDGGVDLDDVLPGRRQRSIGLSMTSPTAPLNIPRAPASDSRHTRGLFDSADLDPYAEKATDASGPSWGWLADEVNAVKRDEAQDRFGMKSAERGYRLLDDGNNARDGRFHSTQTSDDGFYFRREDRRF